MKTTCEKSVVELRSNENGPPKAQFQNNKAACAGAENANSTIALGNAFLLNKMYFRKFERNIACVFFRAQTLIV